MLDFMFNTLGAAKAMYRENRNVSLKTHLENSIDRYNKMMKNKRSYMISGPSRQMIIALSRCPEMVVELLQDHYLQHAHKDSGPLAQLKLAVSQQTTSSDRGNW